MLLVLSRAQCDRKVGTCLVLKSGTALVEFAVVAWVMFLLVLGIIELARGFMVKELLTEAARKGCRVAIIEGTTAQQIKDAATSGLNEAGIDQGKVNISVNDAPLDVATPWSAPAYSELTLKVSVAGSTISWVPGLSLLSGTLTGQFTLQRQ